MQVAGWTLHGELHSLWSRIEWGLWFFFFEKNKNWKKKNIYDQGVENLPVSCHVEQVSIKPWQQWKSSLLIVFFSVRNTQYIEFQKVVHTHYTAYPRNQWSVHRFSADIAFTHTFSIYRYMTEILCNNTSIKYIVLSKYLNKRPTGLAPGALLRLPDRNKRVLPNSYVAVSQGPTCM